MFKPTLERICFSILVLTTPCLLYFAASSPHQPDKAYQEQGSSNVPILLAFERSAPAFHDYIPITPDYTIPPVRNGLAPVISRIPTRQPIVFLGIDDGVYRKSFQLELMKRHNIKATLFLT